MFSTSSRPYTTTLILAAVCVGDVLTSAGFRDRGQPEKCTGVDCEGGGVDDADGTTPPLILTTRLICQSNETVRMAVAEGTGGGLKW